MPVLDTATLLPGAALPASQNHQVYCALDSCLPLEIHPQLDDLVQADASGDVAAVYAFSRALQGPYLDMMTLGFAIDEQARRVATTELRSYRDSLLATLGELAEVVLERPTDPTLANSRQQLMELFYDTMRLPRVVLSRRGERKVSMNREALERLDVYLHARPFVSLILAVRDISKQIQRLETEVDSDGRFRTSYNIAGTETGRSSSSKNAFGSGDNVQNVAPALRYVFVADRGRKLCQIDLEQVEARDEGWFIGCLFNDWSYLDACESGDLHTRTARGIWTQLGWTGDIRRDRQIADRLFYRDFTYRDMAKRGSHLSNYMGSAYTAARVLKVPQTLMENFQARYCRGRVATRSADAIEPAYPGIPRYWQWVAQQLQTTRLLTTPFGRRRHFFGRPGDDATVREGIAYLPQSTTSDRLKLGLLRVWSRMRHVELLGENYDSIVFQFEDRDAAYEERVVAEALAIVEDVVFTHPSGRRYYVPGEAKVGWNWGSEVTQRDIDHARARGDLRLPRLNPDGLRKRVAGVADGRSRTKPFERMSGLAA